GETRVGGGAGFRHTAAQDDLVVPPDDHAGYARAVVRFSGQSVRGLVDHTGALGILSPGARTDVVVRVLRRDESERRDDGEGRGCQGQSRAFSGDAQRSVSRRVRAVVGRHAMASAIAGRPLAGASALSGNDLLATSPTDLATGRLRI